MSYPPRPHPFRSREPQLRRNGKIRAREVRVIDEHKAQLGVMSLSDALRLAQSKGLDLLETVPNASPPVCRIVNYGKFRYEEAKRGKDNQGHHAAKMKELQISPAIAIHDFNVKLAHAIEFLSAEMKVCLKMRFRGRQRAHKEIGLEVLNRFMAEAAAYGRADAPPKLLAERDLTVILSPVSRDKRPKVRPVSVASTPPMPKVLAMPVQPAGLAQAHPSESGDLKEINAPQPD